MSFTRTFLNGILIFAALAALTAPAFAQTTNGTGDKILVSGKYTLKQSDIDRLTELYEWLFAGKFTAAERRQYQKLIVADARVDERTAESIVSMVESFEKIRAASAEKREQVRRELLPEIVSYLEKENNEINELLLNVYQNAGGATADRNQPADDSRNADSRNADSNRGGAVSVADLAGIWSTSSSSGTRYRSLVTGELSDPSGSIIEYQISPNGVIKHVGYLSSTVYSCTTKLFISRTGRISISGARITFDFAPGKRMYQTCSQSASRNDTLPAERKTYPFRLERDEYGVKLCTREENGKDFCIRRKGE